MKKYLHVIVLMAIFLPLNVFSQKLPICIPPPGKIVFEKNYEFRDGAVRVPAKILIEEHEYSRPKNDSESIASFIRNGSWIYIFAEYKKDDWRLAYYNWLGDATTDVAFEDLTLDGEPEIIARGGSGNTYTLTVIRHRSVDQFEEAFYGVSEPPDTTVSVNVCKMDANKGPWNIFEARREFDEGWHDIYKVNLYNWNKEEQKFVVRRRISLPEAQRLMKNRRCLFKSKS